MKKLLTHTIVFSFVFLFGFQIVSADITTPPVVSIGVGNGNLPANTSPVSGETYHGQIYVYGTVADDDLDNYHFRIVKVGESEGHTCVLEGSLFASENQGYASSTLLKDACGFVFNQSVYVSAIGFTNSLIATINTEDIIAWSGEGDYRLILGAVDTAGNRTNSNYLNDASVIVRVSATAPVIPPAPIAPVASAGGSVGGGNGPIVGPFGGGNYSSPVVTNSTANNNGVSNSNSAPVVLAANPVYSSSEVVVSPILADGGLINEDQAIDDSTVTTSEVSVVSSSSEDNLAQAVSSGFNFNWLWIILAILGLGGVIYYFSRETK